MLDTERSTSQIIMHQNRELTLPDAIAEAIHGAACQLSDQDEGLCRAPLFWREPWLNYKHAARLHVTCHAHDRSFQPLERPDDANRAEQACHHVIRATEIEVHHVGTNITAGWILQSGGAQIIIVDIYPIYCVVVL